MSNLLQRTAIALNDAEPVSRETLVIWAPLDQVQDNPYQPRQHYDAEHILNLALSIKRLKKELPASRGLQQIPLARLGTLAGGEFDCAPRFLYGEPAELRRMVRDGHIAQLMFGHSRLRAFRVLYNGLAQFDPTTLANSLVGGPQSTPGEMGIDIDLASVAEWQTRYAELMEPDQDYAAMPITLGFALDIDMWRHAITENSQRKNINAIEEAAAMARAQAEFDLTDEEAGRPFGYARSTAANKMRLLKLPAEVQRDIATGVLTERHGRELLRLADDKERMVKVYTTARKKGQTVAQVTEAVNWEAKALKEEQDKQRQLDAARAILEAGWTPPGSVEPLPTDRIEGSSYATFFFDTADEKAMIRKGICGSHCDCCVLAFKGYYPDSMIRPDAEQAPNIGLGCTGDLRIRKQKQDALAEMKQEGQIQPSEAERRVAEERAQKEAQIRERERQGRERWGAAMRKINRPELWSDLRFWRIILGQVASNPWAFRDLGMKAQSIYEFQALLLDQVFQRTKAYDRELNHHVPDLAEIDKLITALTQPLDKPAQPGPGDSQATGWENGWTEDDQVEYDELTRGGRPDEEILAYVSDWIDGGEFDSPRVLLRLIEECDDKAIRGPLWRHYNELTGVSQETVEEAQS